MHYQSTRSVAQKKDFYDVLLGGLAQDGGLYMPEIWPQFSAEDWRAMRGLRYSELAARVIAPFAAPVLHEADLRAMCAKAYARFDHPAIVPLVEIAPELFSLELFHGPTLAFKDMAMQLLGQLFEDALLKRRANVTIVGATSGDTGSAAIEAFRGRENVSIVILHPEGRTSEVQRRQMTTVTDANVLNIAIRGTFDDCQDLVKAMFADTQFSWEVSLSAVNSINWARIVAQIPYYVHAALALGAPDRDVAFAVPTGNFGNVLAAWAAQKMGLPVARLQIGSNHNDILTRFVLHNDMTVRDVAPSLSPSMDIQVSSNFERLLFEFLGRDHKTCRDTMQAFRRTGKMEVPTEVWRGIQAQFGALKCDDMETRDEIRRLWQESRYLADPHTAIGVAAGRAGHTPGTPMIVAATAHPAKFPDAVEAATGVIAPLPASLSNIMTMQERCDHLDNNLTLVQNAVRAHISQRV